MCLQQTNCMICWMFNKRAYSCKVTSISYALIWISSFLSLGSRFIFKMPKGCSSLFFLIMYSVNERDTRHSKGNWDKGFSCMWVWVAIFDPWLSEWYFSSKILQNKGGSLNNTWYYLMSFVPKRKKMSKREGIKILCCFTGIYFQTYFYLLMLFGISNFYYMFFFIFVCIFFLVCLLCCLYCYYNMF